MFLIFFKCPSGFTPICNLLVYGVKVSAVPFKVVSIQAIHGTNAETSRPATMPGYCLPVFGENYRRQCLDLGNFIVTGRAFCYTWISHREHHKFVDEKPPDM
ncbi:hypothetical protein AVEN_123604-1 [Araneus ventricosus]|uniref:Uncharacterized protein n=1 Tax=Araneus ventricosus TaxID=182803 RepID=A0A4Y2JJ40_ARAVE|nr:hypothetical protein AVEN_259126-1 [Araneus ventricosus]GBM89252.1 hypothetical protein AVEN_123604-1 [Araneus ventricosus]